MCCRCIFATMTNHIVSIKSHGSILCSNLKALAWPVSAQSSLKTRKHNFRCINREIHGKGDQARIPVEITHHKALEVRGHETIEGWAREQSVLRSVRLVVGGHVELRVPQGDADVIQQPWEGSEFENGILQHGKVLEIKKIQRSLACYRVFPTFIIMPLCRLRVGGKRKRIYSRTQNQLSFKVIIS